MDYSAGKRHIGKNCQSRKIRKPNCSCVNTSTKTDRANTALVPMFDGFAYWFIVQSCHRPYNAAGALRLSWCSAKLGLFLGDLDFPDDIVVLGICLNVVQPILPRVVSFAKIIGPEVRTSRFFQLAYYGTHNRFLSVTRDFMMFRHSAAYAPRPSQVEIEV